MLNELEPEHGKHRGRRAAKVEWCAQKPAWRRRVLGKAGLDGTVLLGVSIRGTSDCVTEL